MCLRVSAGQSIDQKADFLRTPIQGDAIPWSKLLDSALLLLMKLGLNLNLLFFGLENGHNFLGSFISVRMCKRATCSIHHNKCI